ncbi:hypothetical protein ACFX1S_009415 [Malus domestica]
MDEMGAEVDMIAYRAKGKRALLVAFGSSLPAIVLGIAGRALRLVDVARLQGWCWVPQTLVGVNPWINARLPVTWMPLSLRGWAISASAPLRLEESGLTTMAVACFRTFLPRRLISSCTFARESFARITS